MDQLIADYDDFVINKKGIPPKGAILKEGDPRKKGLIKKPGLYNGDVLGCIFSKQVNNKLILDCHRFKFFDIVSDKVHDDYTPKMVCVNAMIKSKDKNGKEYILFIKREKEVYDYPEYWDFPAGFIPYDTEPLDRLNDRIIKDLGQAFTNLKTNGKPSFIVSRLKSYGLYYKVNSPYSKEEIEIILEGKLKAGKVKLVCLNELDKFLNGKEKIFPSYLGRIYS